MGGQQSGLASECRNLSSPGRVLAALRSFGSPSPRPGQHASAGSSQALPDDHVAGRSRQSPEIGTSEQEVRQTHSSSSGGEVRRLSFSSVGASCEGTSPLHEEPIVESNQPTAESVPETVRASSQADLLDCSQWEDELDLERAEEFSEPVTSSASKVLGTDQTIADGLVVPLYQEFCSEETNDLGLAPESHQTEPNDKDQLHGGEGEGEPIIVICENGVTGRVGAEHQYNDESSGALPCGSDEVFAKCALEADVKLSDANAGGQDPIAKVTAGVIAEGDEECDEPAARNSHATLTRLVFATDESSDASKDVSAPQCSQAVDEGMASVRSDANHLGESESATINSSAGVDAVGSQGLDRDRDTGSVSQGAEATMDTSDVVLGADDTRDPSYRLSDSSLGDPAANASEAPEDTTESGLAPKTHQEVPNDMDKLFGGEGESDPGIGICQVDLTVKVGVQQRCNDEFSSELPCGRGQVSSDCAVEIDVGISDANAGEQDPVAHAAAGVIGGACDEPAAGNSHTTPTRTANENNESSDPGKVAAAPQCSQTVAEGMASARSDADHGGEGEAATISSPVGADGVGSHGSGEDHGSGCVGHGSEATMDISDAAFGADDTEDPSCRPSDSGLGDHAADASKAPEEPPCGQPHTATCPAASGPVTGRQPEGRRPEGGQPEGAGPGAGKATKGKAARNAEKINTGLRGAAARVRRGVVVRLYGLDARPELNGATGLCVHPSTEEGRWAVHLDRDAPGVFRNVRKENMQVIACGGALRGSAASAATPCRGKRQREAATPLSRDAVIDGIAELECEALKRCAEEERPGLRRRLLFKWHPDKAATGSGRELATKVTQAMQNLPHW